MYRLVTVLVAERVTDDTFRDPAVPVELAVDHPNYAEATPIPEPTRLSLIADLALDL